MADHSRQQQHHHHHSSDDLIEVSPPASGTSTPLFGSQSQSTAGSSYIGSAISGLWRRISSADSTGLFVGGADAGNDVSSSMHSQYSSTFPGSSLLGLSGSNGDGIHGAYTPPRRAASPRGLPSLEPLELTGYRDDTSAGERLLGQGIAEEIRTFLPERLKIGDEWKLLYSLYQNGSSLSTLYALCEEYRGRRAGFVLVVRDGDGSTFGAYLTEAPHPAASYYGTGECFLWRASIHVPLPPPPSADTEDLTYTRSTTVASPTSPVFPKTRLTPGALDPATTTTTTTNKLSPSTAARAQAEAQHSVRFQNFPYTGLNDYCIFCETKFLSVGGGQGASYGLWLDDGFSRGHSGPCDTFGNQPLSSEGEKFEVLGVELWVVGAS